MAAMGQQDCGQCGYNCEDYANAIARSGRSGSISVCRAAKTRPARSRRSSPKFGAVAAPAQAPAIVDNAGGARSASHVSKTRIGTSRDQPVEIAFASRTRLNKPGSNKETWHVDLDLGDSGLAYTVGDSLGIFPRNDPALVDAVIAAVGMPADFPIADRTLRDTLTDDAALGAAPDMLFELISHIAGGERRQKAKSLAGRRRSGRRRQGPGRARGPGKISRYPARSRGLRRSARSTAAAALLDRILAKGRARQGGAQYRRSPLRR